ncbi:NACHT domain-containing protein [Actinosynnema mirum]|uniref:AAA+ ATPase domain-containing protein n=1 Tax=Actinosynnema mirum (strain ATCC 29888 / DSM 43827 / JCM 3225 / NBRC 14064 / NCIMB 13271 / NRRL B-12336 / IMRU 3971 / 101) TaxID=446462 RepID=C6WA27_ACTMD|nr:hypothetical protein [Actinosynnema mirum]ACU39216.1 hypothetical protein Amir_5397 [Actinosynnema mirum DSM 43827]
MAKNLSYREAAKILGGGGSAVITAVEQLTSAVLLGGVAVGLTDLLGWFDAKSDLVRFSRELLSGIAGKRGERSRHDRTRLVEAAHTVIVVTAYFEAVHELAPPFREDAATPDRDHQLQLFGLASLFDGEDVLPAAHRTRKENADLVEGCYRRATKSLITLMADSGEEDVLLWTWAQRVTQTAVRRYDELVRRLAVDYPEITFWLQHAHDMAVSAGLERMETALGLLLTGTTPDTRRGELHGKYRAALERPILKPEDELPGLEFPSIKAGYIDPDYQVFAMDRKAEPGVLSWWERLPLREDLYSYLVGYLTSPKAVTHPALVLGDPGSGKSLLTRVLSARLPPSDFLVVRVELRSAPTEADVVGQVEHGLREALQGSGNWAELSRNAGGALLVVLLDGFDELLQATGVSQTNYLENVQRFQRDCDERGCPVAVVVTSRIGVAGGMAIPSGADVLRLAPFSERHVVRWLEKWGRLNARYFEQRGLAPLAPQTALKHHDLAVQPLLLLMLALYDADDNALRDQGDIGQGGLYERLLTRFAQREVGKEELGRTDADFRKDVENELERLSVVAFAMFHRGAQWVTEKDLNDDMRALLEEQEQERGPGMRTPLTPGGAILGRFFFVQLAEAVRDSQLLRAYEFLHATFGEYLVARHTWYLLADLHENESNRRRRVAIQQPDDDEFHALLSFTPLTTRKSVVDFLVELAANDPKRGEYRWLVEKLFETCGEERSGKRAGYQPVKRPAPARYAVYSLNLVLLPVVLGDRALDVREWHRLTSFWRSQLTEAEWTGVMESLRVRWRKEEILLSYGAENRSFVETEWADRAISLRDAAREAHFTADPAGNVFRYAFEGLPDSRFDVDYARCLVELNASPSDLEGKLDRYLRWSASYPDAVLENLRKDLVVDARMLGVLATTSLGDSSAFQVLFCDRIGHGVENAVLLEVFGKVWQGWNTASCEVALLDAWLRLHESGHEFPEVRSYPGLLEVLGKVNLSAISSVRPDLIKRAMTAASELGVE